MKKILAAATAAVCMIPAILFAGQQTYEENNVYTLLTPRTIATDTTITSTPVAVKQTTKGSGLLLLSIQGLGTGANHGASITLQHSQATGGVFTTYGTTIVARVTGTNEGAVSAVEIDNNSISNYLRVLVVNTNSADAVGAIYVSPK